MILVKFTSGVDRLKHAMIFLNEIIGVNLDDDK